MAICRVGYVECAQAIVLAAGKSALKRFLAHRPSFEVIEVDTPLAERAAELTAAEELGSLDALDLAAALLLDFGV